jgi:hypothetical protein
MKKKVPTEKEIAKKHGVSVETIIKQAEVGSTVEREHVTTHDEAYGIALQHLDEFPDYYTHLLKMEKQLKVEHKKKKTFKEMRQILENHIAVAMGKEIDDEGGMIMSQLDTIENAVTRLRSVVQNSDMQLPGWVQSKVTLATDYIDTVADYMTSKNESVEVSESAWTRKEGQNKNGGLNEKGRKSYERENPGSDLKAPSKKVGNPRRASFCARMKGMRKRQKDSNNTGNDRLSKSLRAWNC